MSTSCVLHPRLSNGEKSPLFSRLKNFLGDRKSAEDVYYRVINTSFREVFPNVRFDHNGEPLLEDLITQCGIGHNKSNEAMLDYLNSEYGTEPVPKTIQSTIELQNRAASFNINNPLNKKYSAELTSSGHDVSMEIVAATGEERSLGRQQRFNAELNNQLVKLLNSWGADVAALTELEEASNINGVMDLSAGINAATGLKEVIRISKRHRWSNVSAKQNVLSEEEQEILNNAPRDSQGRLLAPNGKVSNLTEKQYAQVRTKAFKDWFGDWINSSIIPMSFMPKRGWTIGKIIDNPTEAANICDNTQIKVLNHIIQQFGKPNTRGKFYAKPVIIWAKSPINNLQIHHSTVAVRINGDIYLYDMPQSEYIRYNSENNGTVVKKYSPRLIKYTEENLKNLYGTSNENIHINDESILDDDIIELPLTNASKVVDENGEPLVVYHETDVEWNIFDPSYNIRNKYGTGLYTTIRKELSGRHGNIQMPLFLNIRKPLDGEPLKDNNTINDGVVVKHSDKGPRKLGTWYIAPKSNQIKSAIDNNGNYSNENDNIYESAKLDSDLSSPVISLADIRDRIEPKNRENFERLVSSGVFELTC